MGKGKTSPDRAVKPIFGSSGVVLSRTTKSSLVRRRWQQTFWVHYLPATILIFRDVEDFYQWIDSGDITMPDLKSRLIVSIINFDTQGRLKRNTSEQQPSKTRRICNSKGQSSKIVSRIDRLSLAPVQTKLYGSETL